MKQPQSFRAHLERAHLTLSVAEQVRAELEAQNMTQRELARRLDCSDAYVSQMLNGTRNITLHTLADIACALGKRAKITLEEPAP